MEILEVAGVLPRPDHWKIINLPEYDLTQLPLPFEDESYDGVMSEHFIEHLHRFQAINYIKEAYRLLKPGGVFRTACPTMDLVDWLVEEDRSEHPYVVRQMFRNFIYDTHNISERIAIILLEQNGEHKYLWYVNDLLHMLECLGFTDCRVVKHHESSLEDFKNAEDWRCPIRIFETTIFEARKPYVA